MINLRDEILATVESVGGTWTNEAGIIFVVLEGQTWSFTEPQIERERALNKVRARQGQIQAAVKKFGVKD